MSRRIPHDKRRAVRARSGGRCEAVIEGEGRCPKRATQIQHRLRRGGDAMDRVDDEIRHLAHSCVVHHRQADEYRLDGGYLLVDDDGAERIVPGVVNGYALWDRLLDRPTYHGTDPLFSEIYPPHPTADVSA